MRFTAFYLIEARTELSERIIGLKEPDLEDLLLEPEIISRQEGGRSAWRGEDYTLAIKLLFLARLKEYTPLSPDTAFEKIFGSARLSTQLFDCWWTIRRLEETENAESLHPLLRKFIKLVDDTDSDLVNEWLELERGADSNGS